MNRVLTFTCLHCGFGQDIGGVHDHRLAILGRREAEDTQGNGRTLRVTDLADIVCSPTLDELPDRMGAGRGCKPVVLCCE